MRARDGTLYLVGALGRSDELVLRLRGSRSVCQRSYADVGCCMLSGLPLGVEMQGMEATRGASRRHDLPSRAAAPLLAEFIHYSKGTILHSISPNFHSFFSRQPEFVRVF